MTDFGYALSSEEHPPNELVENARKAEEHGFEFAMISDHFHPWTDSQGNSPFVWGVIGGIAHATQRIRLGTGVTCPTMRIHPAIVAQAAATSAVMLEGRFFLGVGSGEYLNEHVLGDRWPTASVRLEMLEEAVDVMRALWSGETVTREGKHYTVDNAQLFTVPDQPPPVMVSAFGPKSVALAARIGDGYVGTSPQADLVDSFRSQGGGDKPCLAGPKVCWHPDEEQARKLVYRLWPNMGLPGELSQELRTVSHFEQAVSIVDEDSVTGSVPCGPDPDQHVASLRAYVDAGYDELYIHQIGPDQEGFLRFYADEVLPQLR